MNVSDLRAISPRACTEILGDPDWHAMLCRGLHLDPLAFQALPGLSHREASEVDLLDLVGDLLPRPGAVADYDLTFAPRRSSAYQRLLLSLLPETETGLRGVLGAHYDSWMLSRFAERRPGRPQSREFATWARKRLDSPRAQAAQRAFAAALRDPVAIALDVLEAPDHRRPFLRRDGQLVTVYGYSATTAGVQAALRLGRSIRLSTPPGRAGRMRVNGRIGAAALVPVRPSAWYDPQIVDRAWMAGPDPQVWHQSPGTSWSRFFGPTGALARHFDRLLVVSEVDLVVTLRCDHDRSRPPSKAFGGAQLRDHDCQALRDAPDGAARMSLRVPRGRFQIWGGLIADTPH